VDGLVLLAARAGDLDRILGWTTRVPVVPGVRSLRGAGGPDVPHDELPARPPAALGGGRLAAGHLAELGHRRVVQLPGPLDVQPFKDRLEGFAAAAAAVGLADWWVWPAS